VSEGPRRVALVGLPRTGKSTFLGAVWQLIQDDRDGSMLEVDVTGDRSYLQELGERVAQLKEMGRTDVDSDDGLRIVVDFTGKGTVDLDVPDLSGETLRTLVEDRLWLELLRNAIESASGVLLFVHPDRLRLPIRTNFTDEALLDVLSTSDDRSHGDGDGDDGGGEGAPTVPGQPIRFEPRYACTAAKLIDAIENIIDAASPRLPVRLGIVVSAWDEVDGSPTPQEWVEQQLPAVWELCISNPDRVDARVFGISALGGRLPDDKESLLKLSGVFDRAYGRDADGTPVPLSAPISWALSW
jgi:hypothetical protein